MRVFERVGRDQKAVVSVLRHSNEAVLEALKPVVTRNESYFKAVYGLPAVGRMPTPKETIEQWFGFFDELLKEEKGFLLSVVGLLPEKVREPSVVKPVSKAA